jgi:isocitrate dehydrogenase (NAD+)
MKRIQAVLIEGDGIGPEIIRAAVAVLSSTGISMEWDVRPAGLKSLEKYGELVPAETLQAIRHHGAALKGPFSTPSGGSQRSANWYIRRDLDLYACVRPIQAQDRDVDILLVRENTEDLYGAVEWMATPEVAHAVKVASRAGCERIARFAMDLAAKEKRRKVTAIHKANNLKLTEGMFLHIARDVAANYPMIEFDDMLIDTASATLVSKPDLFDVMLTSNTFGDILSSVGAAIVGGPGPVPSANFGTNIVVTEAAHGSAPTLTGTQRANPLAMIAAGAILLDAVGFPQEADAIRRAIRTVRENGIVTPDLGGTATTDAVAAEVARCVKLYLNPTEEGNP